MKDISNQYQYLTADERFRLFVAAIGRKDDQELDRLENTAPVYTYRCVDDAYKLRKVRFIDMGLMSMVGWLQQDLYAAITMALAMTVDDPEETDEQPGRLSSAFRKLYVASRARRQGWKQFCEYLGVEPDAILGRIAGDTDISDKVLELAYDKYCETFGLSADEEQIAKRAQADFEALRDWWEETFPSDKRQ